MHQLESKRSDSDLLERIWTSVHKKLKTMPYIHFLEFSTEKPSPNDYDKLMELDQHQSYWKPDVSELLL